MTSKGSLSEPKQNQLLVAINELVSLYGQRGGIRTHVVSVPGRVTLSLAANQTSLLSDGRARWIRTTTISPFCGGASVLGLLLECLLSNQAQPPMGWSQNLNKFLCVLADGEPSFNPYNQGT